MAVIDLGFLKGKLGDLNVREMNGRQIVSVTNTNCRNPRTLAQMEQRCKWPNMIHFYQQAHDELRGNFEDRSRTVYNHFKSINGKENGVWLTREEVRAKCCVLAPYIISDGSVEEIVWQNRDGCYVSNIRLGSLEMGEEAKVGDVSAHIIKENPDWKAGDILRFIEFRQLEGEEGPTVMGDAKELLLDCGSQIPLWKRLPREAFCKKDGWLAYVPGPDAGAFCLIHVSRKGRKNVVSTQRLMVQTPLYETYSSEEKFQEAVRSYR